MKHIGEFQFDGYDLPDLPGMGTKEKRWASFRKMYKHLEPEIMKSSAARYVISRYELGWNNFATPIEMDAWEEITAALIVLYPQYPIGRYFADFAHPKLKVDLELDGAAWHNPEKDARRDAELIAQGWRVYRVPGSECKRVVDLAKWDERGQWDDEEAFDDLRQWAFRSIEGVVQGIKILHFENLPDYPYFRNSDIEYDGSGWSEFYSTKCEWAIESARLHCVNYRRGGA